MKFKSREAWKAAMFLSHDKRLKICHHGQFAELNGKLEFQWCENCLEQVQLAEKNNEIKA